MPGKGRVGFYASTRLSIFSAVKIVFSRPITVIGGDLLNRILFAGT
jgi:hypothetical protein